MPRYYFHCRVGDVLAEDSEGSLLPDIQAARRDATTLMAELARDELPNEGVSPSVTISVVNNRKSPLFTLQLLSGDQDL